jgi:GxxExxY protein
MGGKEKRGMDKQTKLIKTPYDDLTYAIIGCAMASHRELGSGLREKIYQRDLEQRLAEKQISFNAQKYYDVFGGANRDVLIGYYIPDFVVDDKVVVEIKALTGLSTDHTAQIIAYLAITGCPLGLLINFGGRRLQYRRILPPLKIQEHLVNQQWLFVPKWLKQETGTGFKSETAEKNS